MKSGKYQHHAAPVNHVTRATGIRGEQNGAEAFWEWTTKEATGFFTLSLVVVGGLQLGLFYWQLKLIRESLVDTKKAADAANVSAIATKASVELAEKTAERQLRAYIFVDGGSITLKADSSGQQYVQGLINVRNYGRTPGYRFTTCARMEIRDANFLNF
jgi:hypothetical protein